MHMDIDSYICQHNSHTVNKTFFVVGIPRLVIFDENLKVISRSATGWVEADPDGKVVINFLHCDIFVVCT